jgi:plastocyanin
MANLMRDGMEALASWRESFMSEDIEYFGQNGHVKIKARVGFSTASELDEYGVTVDVRKTDFVFSASAVTPAMGDTILWQGRKYRLSSASGAPCWRFADNHGVSIRVSTKQVDK